MLRGIICAPATVSQSCGELTKVEFVAYDAFVIDFMSQRTLRQLFDITFKQLAQST